MYQRVPHVFSAAAEDMGIRSPPPKKKDSLSPPAPRVFLSFLNPTPQTLHPIPQTRDPIPQTLFPTQLLRCNLSRFAVLVAILDLGPQSLRFALLTLFRIQVRQVELRHIG